MTQRVRLELAILIAGLIGGVLATVYLESLVKDHAWIATLSAAVALLLFLYGTLSIARAIDTVLRWIGRGWGLPPNWGA